MPESPTFQALTVPYRSPNRIEAELDVLGVRAFDRGVLQDGVALGLLVHRELKEGREGGREGGGV